MTLWRVAPKEWNHQGFQWTRVWLNMVVSLNWLSMCIFLWSLYCIHIIYRCCSALMKWADSKNSTYAISTLLQTAEWGKDQPFDDKTRLLCERGTNMPYVTWIVGCMSKGWFFESRGATRQVSISLIPLDQEDSFITSTCWLCNPILHFVGQPMLKWLKLIPSM